MLPSSAVPSGMRTLTSRSTRTSWARSEVAHRRLNIVALLRLHSRHARLLGVGLDLGLDELLELRRRVGDRLDADLHQAAAHLGVLHRRAHLAVELLDDVRRRVR